MDVRKALASKSSGVKFSKQIKQTGCVPLGERFKLLLPSSLPITFVEVLCALGLTAGLISPVDNADGCLWKGEGEGEVGLSRF